MAISTIWAGLATQALQQSAIPALRRIAVEETDEVLSLSGRVSSYYFKQMAQETVLPYLGGRELVNRISVVKEEKA
jgi:hypothetical protein